MSALDRARPSGAGREPAAAAVAADGLGHLAPAPLRARRRGRAPGRAGGVPVDRRPSAAPRLRRRDRLPPGRLACLQSTWSSSFNGMDRPSVEWLRAAAGARADRGIRRRAAAGPRAGDRHLPLRLDAGLRPVALDARQAGAARGRGDRRRRSLQRAVLLVLPAVLRRGQPGPVPYRAVPARLRPVRPARDRVRRLDAGRLRDRRPGRHAHPPGRPRDRRHPRRICRRSPSRPGCSCASTT